MNENFELTKSLYTFYLLSIQLIGDANPSSKFLREDNIELAEQPYFGE